MFMTATQGVLQRRSIPIKRLKHSGFVRPHNVSEECGKEQWRMLCFCSSCNKSFFRLLMTGWSSFMRLSHICSHHMLNVLYAIKQCLIFNLTDAWKVFYGPGNNVCLMLHHCMSLCLYGLFRFTLQHFSLNAHVAFLCNDNWLVNNRWPSWAGLIVIKWHPDASRVSHW